MTFLGFVAMLALNASPEDEFEKCCGMYNGGLFVAFSAIYLYKLATHLIDGLDPMCRTIQSTMYSRLSVFR